MYMVPPPLQCLLLALPPVFISVYILTQFPSNPTSRVPTCHSLADLPATNPARVIYPEDFYEGGAYASLPFGRMRYWLIGPESGRRIVLIHGLSVPAVIWKDVAPALAAHGFRVLLYDLYGRGYSDAPQMIYDTPLYVTQLALLMQHIGWEKANLAGISMGGAIATAFTHHFPALVDDHVALIASAGLMQSSDMSRTSKFMSAPLVQTVASSFPFRLYLRHLANSNTSTKVSNPGWKQSVADVVRTQSAHLPGYNSALASSLRDGPIRGLEHAFKSLGEVGDGEKGKKVLVIHGTADDTVPYKYASSITTLVPHATLLTIPQGPHYLTVSHPEEVGKALAAFFAE